MRSLNMIALFGVVLTLLLMAAAGCEEQPKLVDTSPKFTTIKEREVFSGITVRTMEYQGERYLIVSHEQGVSICPMTKPEVLPLPVRIIPDLPAESPQVHSTSP